MNHVEGPTGFRAILEPWIREKWVEIVEGEIRFKKWGSKIFLRHCQYERDLPRLLGPEIHVLLIEEAGQFSESMIRFIRGRMRIPDTLKIPDKYLLPEHLWVDPTEPEHCFPRAIYTSNPGGIGHSYLKKSFVQGFEPMSLHRAPEDDGGMLRQFIPARVDDNPSINRKKYEANLKGLGSPQLIKSLLDGDWDAIVGAFFPELEKRTHLIHPFAIPDYWTRFMSMDWGACGDGDPFSIGWWAVSDGSIPLFPRHSLICYRSWYGRGLPKITASRIAEGIAEREDKDPPIINRVAGGDILEKRGHGESIFEIFSNNGIHFSRADMRRVSGWQQVRERLVGANNTPLLYWFHECENALETMITLQHDPRDPNDCSPGDDHFADMVRYACMSRPWARTKPPSEIPFEQKFTPPSIDDLWAEREALMRSSRR